MVIRFEEPEDFRVDEVPLYSPAGEGEHTFLRIEKRNRTTEDVAHELARAAGVPPRDVGYAGRKDRVAVATQWFSVPRLAPETALGLPLQDARVLEALRHPHKLRTGQLRANRFEILLRGRADAADEAARRLGQLVRVGMPNRFGVQRFGRDGTNPDLARRILAGELELRARRRARFLLSSLQAEVFNTVLAERGEALSRLLLGDIAVVHQTGGLFLVDDPEREEPRVRSFEISATGPIFGTRMRAPGGDVARRERAALEASGVPSEDLRPPRGIRLRGARRALRVRPLNARVEALGADLRVECTLPPGSYASVLIELLLGLDAVPDARPG